MKTRISRATAEPELDLLGQPDLRGHMFFCPVMCDIWEEHFGRENLDPGTLSNLRQFRQYPTTSCTQCQMDAIPEPDRSVLLVLLAEVKGC